MVSLWEQAIGTAWIYGVGPLPLAVRTSYSVSVLQAQSPTRPEALHSPPAAQTLWPSLTRRQGGDGTAQWVANQSITVPSAISPCVPNVVDGGGSGQSDRYCPWWDGQLHPVRSRQVDLQVAT